MSAAHNQLLRQLHGWSAWDVIVDLAHDARDAVAPSVSSLVWAVSYVSDFYFARLFGWPTVLYALACFAWIVFAPSVIPPKAYGFSAFGRARYAVAMGATVFYYRGVLFSLSPWKMVFAIATYLYLATQRLDF